MREDLREICVNLIKKSSTGNNSIFNDFIKTRSEFPSWQGLQEFGVCHNDDRLVEGADQVLAEGMVDANFSTYGAIYLCEQRGWHMNQLNTTQEC